MLRQRTSAWSTQRLYKCLRVKYTNIITTQNVDCQYTLKRNLSLAVRRLFTDVEWLKRWNVALNELGELRLGLGKLGLGANARNELGLGESTLGDNTGEVTFATELGELKLGVGAEKLERLLRYIFSFHN